MASLRWGRVAAIHPEDYSVDLVMTDDGSHLAGVQVLTPHASTNSGNNCLSKPATSSSGDPWDLTEETDRDVIAGVAFFGPYPVVLGFRFPQVCQMLFADLERAINRHPSDFYTSIDAQGNFEAYHPSGTYWRIGTSPDHEDLTGKDFDGKWKIAKNTASAPHVHLTVANAGAPVATFDVDPSGNVAMQNNGNLTAQVGKDVTATVGGKVAATVQGTLDATVQGAVTVNAPAGTTFNGPVTVNGPLTYTQGMSGSGGSGAAATIAGNVTVTGGDVTVDGIGTKSHHHDDPQGGETSAAKA